MQAQQICMKKIDLHCQSRKLSKDCRFIVTRDCKRFTDSFAVADRNRVTSISCICCRASDDGGPGGPWPPHFFAKYATKNLLIIVFIHFNPNPYGFFSSYHFWRGRGSFHPPLKTTLDSSEFNTTWYTCRSSHF